MQKYETILGTESLSTSLVKILDNSKTIMSCSSSATEFPASNLEVGMLCFRIDEDRLYKLTTIHPTDPAQNTWVSISDLSTLLDTTIGTTGAGQILVWNETAGDASTGGWVNLSLADAGISELGHDHTLTDFLDIVVTTVEDKQILRWDPEGIDSSTGAWVNSTLADADISSTSHGHDFSDLGGTSIGADLNPVVDGNVLSVVGGKWTNSTPAIAGLSANNHDHDSTYLKLSNGTVTGKVSGPVEFTGSVTIEGCTFFNGTDPWIRAVGGTGLYFSDFGGGIYMPDASYTVIYGNKALKVNNAIVATGNITAYFSDERLKTKTRNVENALDKVCSLNGFYYEHNDIAIENGYKADGEHLGLSAQEVQAIAPEIVTPAPFDILPDEHIEGKFTSKTGEDYLTVDYSKLVPLLVEAIKEQQVQIDELKLQIKGAS